MIFVLDFETTGLNPYHDDIIEGETLDKDQNKKDEL